jgi:hypothetical protein
VGKKHNWTVALLDQLIHDFDILFLQEPPWATVRYTASLTEKDGTPIKGPPIHPDWIPMFPKGFDAAEDRPRVIAYVNRTIRVVKPKLRSDIVNHRDVMIVTVRGHLGPLHLMNVYSDDGGSAIRYLEDHLDEFPALGYMGGDFNCPSSHWDPTCLRAHPLANTLEECATVLNMERVAPPSGGVTHRPYNAALRGSILDLVFVPIYRASTGYPTLGDKGEPDHLPLLLDIPLKVFWPAGKKSITPDSDEEADFLGEIIVSLGNILIPDIVSGDQTQAVATAITKVFEEAWTHFAKTKRACSRSKSWWDRECAETKAAAMDSDLPADWFAFKKATRAAKRKHFDARIDEIAVKNLRPWDLMDWVGPCKTPPVESISYQGAPCTTPDLLWNALHSTFNSAQDRPIDLTVLGDKWESPTIQAWIPYSAAEMSDALLGTSNRSAPGPDHITWRHLKRILRDGYSEQLFLWLANACLTTGVWPDEFKVSITVVIPKPGKPLYNTPKSFRPIVLLNTMGKLLEKMLANCLQFEAAEHGVLHPNQFGGV